MVSRALLLCLCTLVTVSSFGIFSRPNPLTRDAIRPTRQKQGALKLCPPGGSSFIDAFNLICPMRRKRRSADRDAPDAHETEKYTRERRGFSMAKTMELCCSHGCDFSDILPLCNPFN